MITQEINDQLAKAPPNVRETANALQLTVATASGVVWGVSKWGEADWPDKATEKRLNQVQGSKSKGKQRDKHWIDTLASVTSINKADVFVSKDKTGRNAVQRIVALDDLKLQLWDYEEFRCRVIELHSSKKGLQGRK
jgi:hypothetical protein